ncbi:hypothetical protein D3C72_1380630 [compost metagenome]
MEQVKSNFEIARGIVRRYMANFTDSTTPPKTVKGGFFAMIASDTGEVWLGEAQSFQATITRFRGTTGEQIADCMAQAKLRGAKLELWLLTQPTRFSAQELENELYECDLLAGRKRPNREGAGKLFVIRHRVSLNYFVVNSRQELAQESILNNFLYRLSTTGADVHNKRLADFITEYAADVLAQRGFDITYIADFVDNDDLWLKRQCYVDDCQSGDCLNYRNVELV